MYIAFFIVPFILLLVAILLLRKTIKLKKQLRQESIEKLDKELEQLLNKKKEECNKSILEVEQAAEDKQKWLQQTIENNEQIIEKQEKHKSLLLEKEKELINKEIENYQITRRNEIQAELDKLWNISYNNIEKQKIDSQNEIEQNKLKAQNEINKIKSDFQLTFQTEKIELEKQFEERKEQINSEIVQLLLNKSDIETDLEDYRNKRAAVNEAILREKELQEKETFYKIDIPENDREDIQILREIEPRLRNKEALNKLIYDVFIKRPSQEMIKRITKGRKISGIYKITYIGTGEAYVGRTSDIANRWKQHIMSSLNIGTIAHTTFHTFLANKGLHQFTFEILEEVDKDKLNEREKYWISFYETDKQLNSNSGG